MERKDSDNARAEQARNESPFLSTTQAGSYVGLSRRTLEKMRTTGNGPVYRKHGRYVRYHIADLDAWSTARRKNSTSDYGVEALPTPTKRPSSEKSAPPSDQRKGTARKGLKGDRSHA